ncbi:MAG: phage tail protein [Tetragenococcus koreensis]|nr:phage tail protein [Tetragenococcus koreensis]
MIFYVLDNRMNFLTMIDTTSDSNILFEGKIEYGLNNNVLLYTLDATIYKTTEDSQYFTPPNCIMFENSFGNMVICSIRTINNEDKFKREIHCEDLGMDLLNNSAFAYAANKRQKIKYYLERELYNTGWEIGINEMPDTYKRVEFTNSETVLARVQSLAQEYDCEITFNVEMRNNKIKRKLLNIHRRLGSDKLDTVLRDGDNIVTLTKSLDATDIKTAIIVPGIAKIKYDDGRFYSLKGEETIQDRIAMSEWGTAITKKDYNSGWYYATFEGSDDMDNAERFTAGIEQLKGVNEPKIEYSVEAIYDDAEFEIGDYIMLNDEEFNPPLRVKARVTNKATSPDVESNNELTLDNFTELKSQISNRYTSFQERLEGVKDENITTEIQTTSQGNQRILSCHVYRNGVEITNDLKDMQFIWTKRDKDGVLDLDFGKPTGKTTTDSLDQIVRESFYECTVIYYKNRYVSKRYFIDGLIELASKVELARDENSIVLGFITDTHAATQSVIRDNIEYVTKSFDHLKNVSDFTHITDVDAVVLGGDQVDGTTIKDVTLRDLQSVVGICNTFDAPFLQVRGNHDDNSSADQKYGQFLSNMVMPEELYSYMVRPSIDFGLVENPNDRNMYYYYDIPAKNMRLIVLNNFDMPYTLTEQGKTKYRANKMGSYRQQQIDWFIKVLKETPEDWQVTLFEHNGFGEGAGKPGYIPINWEIMTGIVEAYVNGKSFKKSGTTKDFEASVDVKFDRKGVITFMATGHHHKDYESKMYGINHVGTTCSRANESYDAPSRPLGELAEDAWDVFVIHPDRREVEIKRFGDGKDRRFVY